MHTPDDTPNQQDAELAAQPEVLERVKAGIADHSDFIPGRPARDSRFFQTFVSKTSTLRAFRLEQFQDDLPEGLVPVAGWEAKENGYPEGGVWAWTTDNQRVFIEPGHWVAAEAEPGRYYPIANHAFQRRWEPEEPVGTGVLSQATERFFTASEHPDVVALREHIVALAAQIMVRVPEGRNKALALTALEDVQMRGNRGLFAPAHLR